jgi:hypothetical protein
MLWTCEVGVRISVLTILAFVVAAFPILALSKNSTDAARDGLKGAVKSVSTERQIVSPPPSQPDGPTIIYPIWCEVCEYDRDGNVVRRGQNWETGFVGETARYVRDEDGTVRQEIVENEKGELDRTVIIGRFGKTEEEFYQHGVLQSRNKYLYDQNGNIIEWLTHDAHGVETARTVASFDEQGTITEQFDYGPNNRFLLHYTQPMTAKWMFRRSPTSTKMELFGFALSRRETGLRATGSSRAMCTSWEVLSALRLGVSRAIPMAACFGR